jgi:hypothetical protein
MERDMETEMESGVLSRKMGRMMWKVLSGFKCN